MVELDNRQDIRDALEESATAQHADSESPRIASEALDSLHSDMLAVRYRQRAGDFFARLVRRPRLVEDDELDDLVDEGIGAGAFDLDTGLDLLRADVIAHGWRRRDDHETYLVIQVAARIRPGDVERAARRAGALGKLRSALPVVAGLWVTSQARQLAAAAGVWQVLDGSTIAPNAALPGSP